VVGFQLSFSGKGSGRIGNVFGGLMFAGIATVFIVLGIVVTVRSGWQAYTWQKTDATVLRVEGGGEGDDHVTATYSFAAGAHDYEAYERTVHAEFGNQDYRKIAGWRPGNLISIWYDPSHPGVSEPELQSTAAALGFSLFAVPFFVIGVGLIRSSIRGQPDLGTPSWRMAVLAGLCCVGGFGFIFAATVLPFHWGLAVFLGYVAVVIPLVLRWSNRLAQRLKEQPKVTPASGEVRLPVGKLLGWLAFAIFWCGITGVFVGWASLALVRSVMASHWPTAPGEVLISRVESHPGKGGATYEPYIRYRYPVGDRKYVNDRCDFLGGSASDGNYAERLVAAHPQGSAVAVYYNPADPNSSVLTPGVPPLAYLMAIFIQPFVVIGLAILVQSLVLVFRYRQLRRFLAAPLTLPWHIPLWGVLRPTAGAATIRGRRPGLGAAAMAFAGGYGITTFAAIFILAFGVGMTQVTTTMFLATLAMSVAAGLAATAYFGFWHRQTRVVTFNFVDHTLTVRDRADRQSVALNDITGWRVRRVPIGRRIWSKARKNGGSQLEAVTRDGRAVPLHVFEDSVVLEHTHTELVVRRVRQGAAQLTETPEEACPS
jgi:hypothetical protein